MKRYGGVGSVAFVLVMVALLGLTVSVGSAQRPEESWLSMDMSFGRNDAAAARGLLGMLVVRNEGSEQVSMDGVTVDLPAGVVYVGQAAGSDVASEARVAQGKARWDGPFVLNPGEELEIRYWVVLNGQGTSEVSVAQASILGEEGVLVKADVPLTLAPEIAPNDPQTQEAKVESTSPAMPEAVRVGKAAEPSLVDPGSGVAYTVVFTNTGGAVTLDTITDLLPAPFEYVGLAISSEIDQEPTDQGAPEIVWTGDFQVPASETLTLRYWAWVPPQTPVTQTPYVNSVTADHGSSTIGPASAAVKTKGADVKVAKTAWPEEVDAGDPVVYTVTFENEGTGEGVLDLISDTLPSGFTFLDMEPGSDITQAPDGTSGTITWAGPFEVPAGGSLGLVYQVESALAGGALFPTNEVEALMDGGIVGPASASVRMLKNSVYIPMVVNKYTLPHFTVTKEATPNEVGEGEMVVYSVLFTNQGDLPGALMTIEDTLPEGFTFQAIEDGSQVTNLPDATTGTIVWTGPYIVGAHDDLLLKYEVQASSIGGTYVNEVTATTLSGHRPEELGRATVTVKPSFLLADDFEEGVGKWTPFTNYWRNLEEQWFWDMGQGFQGSHSYTNYGNAGTDPARPERGAHDSVSMYLGEGSEEWTDYRYRVKFTLLGGRQAGVWFRGTYREVETKGQWITGYYFSVRVRDEGGGDSAYLWQLRTEEEPGGEDVLEYLYHFSNPLELEEVDLQTVNVEPGDWHEIIIEVRGPHIKAYVDDELAIDFVDEEGSIFLKGTVGMYTYGKWPNAAVVKYDDVLVEPLD